MAAWLAVFLGAEIGREINGGVQLAARHAFFGFIKVGIFLASLILRTLSCLALELNCW